MAQEEERKQQAKGPGRWRPPVVGRILRFGSPQRSPWREIYLVALILLGIGITIYVAVLLAQDRVDTLLGSVAIAVNSIVIFRNASALRKKERRGKRYRRVTPRDVGATLLVGLLTVGIISAFADVAPFSTMKADIVEFFGGGEEGPPGGEASTPTPAPSPTPTPTPQPTAAGPLPQLQVHFIDVGQGDSILLDLAETEVLIDGGDRSPGVVSYLKDLVDGHLEAMIATHPHADHIGGLIAVLDAFQVEEIWHNGDTSTSATYSDFMDRVNAEDADVNIARRGDVLVVDGLIVYVLHPVDPLVDDTNNNSIVLMLSYGDVDFLFTGDAEKEAEAAMLVAADMPVPDVEILKVGHHGSRTSSSRDFLALTSPEVAIYMAGKDNQYGHPHEETLAALKEIGAAVYGTDRNGDIVVTTDGETYAVATEK